MDWKKRKRLRRLSKKPLNGVIAKRPYIYPVYVKQRVRGRTGIYVHAHMLLHKKKYIKRLRERFFAMPEWDRIFANNPRLCADSEATEGEVKKVLLSRIRETIDMLLRDNTVKPDKILLPHPIPPLKESDLNWDQDAIDHPLFPPIREG